MRLPFANRLTNRLRIAATRSQEDIMDRLKALQIFKAVVNAGSFSGAANALDLSTPSVSRTVQELEEVLGARLLHRTTRRVTLTSVGADVLARIDGVLDSYDELSAVSRSSARIPAGVVRLVAPTEIGSRYLGSQIAAFRVGHPEVTVDLQLNDSTGSGLDDEADLALCLADRLRPTQITRPLARIPAGLFATDDYLARMGEPLNPGALSSHDCLTCGGSKGRQAWVMRHMASGASQTIEVQGSMNSNHTEALLEAAVHGAGIVMLPLAQARLHGPLRRVLNDWEVDSQTLHITYRSRKNQPLAVRRLIEHLVAGFAATAGGLAA
jgi:DNA-binding transcriptional LysR family regulator